MIYIVKSKSKQLNLKRIQFFSTLYKIPIKLVPVNFKWLIAVASTNSPREKICNLMDPNLYSFSILIVSSIKLMHLVDLVHFQWIQWIIINVSSSTSHKKNSVVTSFQLSVCLSGILRKFFLTHSIMNRFW